MDKTSEEYANKLAEEIYPKEGEDSFYGDLGIVQKLACAYGYMKAIEENNVKEIREALEKTLRLKGNKSAMEHINPEFFDSISEALEKAKTNKG